MDHVEKHVNKLIRNKQNLEGTCQRNYFFANTKKLK